MTRPSRIRVLIVDDEPIARDTLRVLLEPDPEVAVVGFCRSGREAVDVLRRLEIDLVFLDIHMPDLSGLDVVREVGPTSMPAVIFVTAFDEHALEAFDARAIDYVLKPFDDTRFHEALTRAKQRVTEKKDAELGRRLSSLVLDEEAETARPERLQDCRIAVREAGSLVLLDPAEIDFIESADYYARIHSGDQTWLLRESLESLEARLDPTRFLRIHRSYILNLHRVRTVQRRRSGEAVVLLRDGRELRVSRSRRAELERRLRSLRH